MIDAIEPSVCEEWDAFVASHPASTCHHLSGWASAVARVYRSPALLLASRAARGAPIRAALPFFICPRPLGRYATSGVFGAYGPLLGEGEAVAELLSAARSLSDARGARYLHVKALHDGPTPEGFRRQDVWVRARLSLEGGGGSVWKRFRSSIRAAVRQAQRAGLEVSWGKAGLAGFYDVLAENMHAKGSPIYGLSFLEEAVASLGDRADVVTVRRGGETLGGAMVVAFNGSLTVPFASSRPASLRLRPNNLLYWSMIERACSAGLSWLDFGSSMRETSSLAFKLGWGAVSEPIASLVYSRDGGDPDLGPGAPAVQAGVRLWRRLPRALADALGPFVCRLMT